MQGQRLPDVVMGQPEGWERWERRGTDTYMETIAPPGSYLKVLKDDGSTSCWYVRAPNGDVASIGFDKHAVEEFADGTISVSPSLVFPHGGRWHGYLRRGVWSSV